MQLETIIKLLKENKNCFGYVKADTILKSIQENLKCYELVVSVMRTSDKDIDIQNILNKIVIPICKAKQVLTRLNNDEVHVFTRKVTNLHIINNAFAKINNSLGEQEGFAILTNYDLIREDIRSKEIN